MKKIKNHPVNCSKELLKFNKIEIINLCSLNKISGGNNIITTDDHNITDIITHVVKISKRC